MMVVDFGPRDPEIRSKTKILNSSSAFITKLTGLKLHGVMEKCETKVCTVVVYQIFRFSIMGSNGVKKISIMGSNGSPGELQDSWSYF